MKEKYGVGPYPYTIFLLTEPIIFLELLKDTTVFLRRFVVY